MQYSQFKRCECSHTRATHNYTNPNTNNGNPGGYKHCRGSNCECKEYTIAAKQPKEAEHAKYSRR
jgi:hypothetical protein